MASGKLKKALSRQKTWSGIGLVALALAPVFPAYAVHLTAVAGVAGGLKLILSDTSDTVGDEIDARLSARLDSRGTDQQDR